MGLCRVEYDAKGVVSVYRFQAESDGYNGDRIMRRKRLKEAYNPHDSVHKQSKQTILNNNK